MLHILPASLIVGTIVVVVIYTTNYEKKLLDAIFSDVFFYLVLLVRQIFNLIISLMNLNFFARWYSIKNYLLFQQQQLTGLIDGLLALLAGVMLTVAAFGSASSEATPGLLLITIGVLFMLYAFSLLSSDGVISRVIEAMESGEIGCAEKNIFSQNPKLFLISYNIILLLFLVIWFISKLSSA